MDVPTFFWYFAGVGIAILLLSRFERWSIRRTAKRLHRELKAGKYQDSALSPESEIKVHFSEMDVECIHPEGQVEKIAWADLECVEVVTTDQGPFLPDVFWVLHGSLGGCVFPLGATGEREVLSRLQKLPGFDHEAVIKAMSCTDNHRFLCWERKTSPRLPEASGSAS